MKTEQKILREMWLGYGAGFACDAKKLRAFLMDMQVPKKWIHLLVALSELPYFKEFLEEVPQDLSAREKLAYAAAEAYPFDEQARCFGADCWTYAVTGTDFAELYEAQPQELEDTSAGAENIDSPPPETAKAEIVQNSDEEMDLLCGHNTAKRLALQGERDRAAFLADLKKGRLGIAHGDDAAAGKAGGLTESDAKGIAEALRTLLTQE